MPVQDNASILDCIHIILSHYVTNNSVVENKDIGLKSYILYLS